MSTAFDEDFDDELGGLNLIDDEDDDAEDEAEESDDFVDIVDLDDEEESEDDEDSDSEKSDDDTDDDEDEEVEDEDEGGSSQESQLSSSRRPVTNVTEDFAREAMRIQSEIDAQKEELVTSEQIPEIAFGTYSTPDASQWTVRDMTKRRRASIRPDAGASLPALFYGYPRDVEIRPPALIVPNRPVYEVSKENPPSEERWNEVRSRWTRGPQSSMKARNDRLAKELRESLVIDGRDTDMLFFLWRFRNTAPIIIAYLLDTPVTQVLARLRQLKRAGLVIESGTMGGPLFSISAYGARSLGLIPLPTKEPSQQSFNHNTVVAMIAALAERGELNPFHEDKPVPSMRPPFPKWNDEDVFVPGAWGGPVSESDLADGLRRGFRCISELELRSAWSKWTKANDFTQEQAYQAAKSELSNWDGRGLSPELMTGNEYLLQVQSGLTFEEHAPDLIVKMPRGDNGEPQSLCVEVEMKSKKDGSEYYSQKFQDILLSGRYGEVHYFCPSASVALPIKRGADQAINSGVDGRIFVHEVVPVFGGREFFWRRN